MKHEIEIPYLPEGWEAVAYRQATYGERYLLNLRPVTNGFRKTSSPVLIIQEKQPRRIVLDESDIDNYDIVYRQNGGTTTYWKIVEDNKCAE